MSNKNTILYITKKGRGNEDKPNDMIDIAEDYLMKTIKEKDIKQKIRKQLSNLRTKYQKENEIRLAEQEQSQLINNLYIAYLWDHKTISTTLDEKIKYELKEAEDRRGDKWSESPKKLLGRIEQIDFSKYGKIVDSYIGQSDYLVIIIPQKHDLDKVHQVKIDKKILKQVKIEIEGLLEILLINNISNVVTIETIGIDQPGELNAKTKPYLFLLNTTAEFLHESKYQEKVHTFGIEDEFIYSVAKDLFILASKLKLLVKKEKNDKLKPEKIEKIKQLLEKEDWTCSSLANYLGENETEKIILLTVFTELIDGKKKPEDAISFNLDLHKKTINQLMLEAYKYGVKKRNEIIPKNLHTIRDNTLSNAISLVFGAGHFRTSKKIDTITSKVLKKTPPMQKHFKDEKVSYVAIMPNSLSAMEETFEK